MTRLRALERVVPAIAVLLAVLAVALALLVRATVREDRHQLHEVQAQKVAALLESSVARIGSELRVLAVVADNSGPDGEVVASLARALLESATTGSEVFIVDAGSVVAAFGNSGPASDSQAAAVTLARRAVDESGLVSAVVHPDGTATAVVLAIESSTGLVVARSYPVSGPTPIDYPSQSPYADLDFELYASTDASPDALVLTSSAERLTRDTVESTVGIGADDWRLVTAERTALSPGLSSYLWLIVLAGGLLAAVAAGAIIVLLRRRRAFAVDLVERKTAELNATLRQLADARDAADRANRAKSEFLSRMSHELRTPLNSVLGFAQLLEFDDLSDDQLASVRKIRRAGDHLLGLIDEVLDIARIESGTISLSPEPVLVSEMLEEVFDLHRPIADQAGIQLDLSLCDTCDHYVLADRQRLKQILLNLVSNAIKYNRPNGSVIVDCRCHESAEAAHKLAVRVSDTGLGIPADRLPALFTPFERLGAEQRNIAGTGIGLALSRQLAEALGGTLELESTSDGGSTFTLTLDEVEGPSQRFARRNGLASTGSKRSSKPTLLYVDDNLENVKLIERILEMRPHIEVVSLLQGRHAMEMVEAHRPGLVILDVHLPDMSGADILHQLRQGGSAPGITVVMLSADASPGQSRRLLNAGADHYLTKPVDVKRLLDIVDETLPVTKQT